MSIAVLSRVDEIVGEHPGDSQVDSRPSLVRLGKLMSWKFLPCDMQEVDPLPTAEAATKNPPWGSLS